ncbi:MAG: hypothetical protein ACTS3F_10795 [Phycisphaerales bacterium]
MAEVVTPEPRLPWHNPHVRPSDATLVAHYAEPVPALVARARERLVGMGGAEGSVVEEMAWRGLPWRWSWEYRLGPGAGGGKGGSGGGSGGSAAGEDGIGLAYLVPMVAAPMVCVPLSYDMYEAMPKGVATNFVREGITLAKEIGDHRWAEWPVAQESHLDELLAVIEHKAAFVRSA